MKPTVTLDTRQWVAAARELQATDKRTCVDFINGQTLRVVSFAVEETKRAEAAKIATALGQVGTEVKLSKSRKTGKTSFRKGGRQIHHDAVNTLAARIIGRIWDKSAWKPAQAAKLEGKSLVEQIRIFIGWRTRAAAFIASGWIPAIKRFSSIVYEKPKDITSRKGANQFGKPKGSAKPATFSVGSVITATAINAALMTTSQLAGGNPMPIATEGLQKALNKAARDMMLKPAQRRQRDFNKVNAR